MANTVSVKFKVDGTDFKKIEIDVEDLGEAIESVKKKVDKLNDSVINWNQAAQAIDTLSGSWNDLKTAFANVESAYYDQVEAETKLATAMRNTMGATDSEIQSIKDLCSAQQQLGIIGDEVQLAGAQELSTYLGLSSSLETLIPVMNDMVAQQYGFNATQESAVNIATMMGKVMEGQTGALSRYGYSFTEAQEQILKFGTESEKAATLAQRVNNKSNQYFRLCRRFGISVFIN